MADNHHLLPFLALILLILLPSSSHATTHQAMFTEPLQFLFGGQSLTDGDLTLSLSNDCGLILYKAGIPVVDFNTSTTTSNCALVVNLIGQLILVPDNEQTLTQVIGKKGNSVGRYALLFMENDNSLGIFGPAIWNNGVNRNSSQLSTLRHEKPDTGSAGYILLSDNIVAGSANGDVVVAQNGKVSAVITNHCTLAVKDDTNNVIIWETGPKSNGPTECFLELKSNGELLLQGYNESGLYTQWSTSGYTARENLYVCVLRYYGRIAIYGLKTWLYDYGSSSAAAASVDVAENNIKMVTA